MLRGAKERFLANPVAWCRAWRARWIAQHVDALIARTTCVPPDFIIGGKDDPYVLRWYLLGGRWKRTPGEEPRWVSRSFLGLRPYLHCFLRSDDDRAHHDHPAPSFSRGLRGQGIEHTIAAGGVHHRRALRAGQWRFRSATFAHRIEIAPGTEFWTLFVFFSFFRKPREWGFHCKNGWVHWKIFTAAEDRGAIGRGCGEGMPEGGRTRWNVTVPAPLAQPEVTHVS